MVSDIPSKTHNAIKMEVEDKSRRGRESHKPTTVYGRRLKKENAAQKKMQHDLTVLGSY